MCSSDIQLSVVSLKNCHLVFVVFGQKNLETDRASAVPICAYTWKSQWKQINPHKDWN